MLILYGALLCLTLLQGCSWFASKEAPSSESIAQIMNNNQKDNNDIVDAIKQVPTTTNSTSSPIVVDQQKTVATETKRQSRKQRRADKQTQQKKNVKTVAEIETLPSFDDEQEDTNKDLTKAKSPLYQTRFAQPTTHQASLSRNIRQITITNNIEKPMLKVKHWTGTYSPTLLNLTINGTQIELIDKKKLIPSGDRYTINAPDNILTVTFEYEFMNGMRKGDGTTEFIVDANQNSLSMTFSWDTSWHAEFDHATPQK